MTTKGFGDLAFRLSFGYVPEGVANALDDMSEWLVSQGHPACAAIQHIIKNVDQLQETFTPELLKLIKVVEEVAKGEESSEQLDAAYKAYTESLSEPSERPLSIDQDFRRNLIVWSEVATIQTQWYWRCPTCLNYYHLGQHCLECEGEK